jgi:hypothetical protein
MYNDVVQFCAGGDWPSWSATSILIHLSFVFLWNNSGPMKQFLSSAPHPSHRNSSDHLCLQLYSANHYRPKSCHPVPLTTQIGSPSHSDDAAVSLKSDTIFHSSHPILLRPEGQRVLRLYFAHSKVTWQPIIPGSA